MADKKPGFPMINLKGYARTMNLSRGTRGTMRFRTDMPITFLWGDEERRNWDERWEKIQWDDYHRDRYPQVDGDHCVDCGAKTGLEPTSHGSHICAYCMRARLGGSDEPNPDAYDEIRKREMGRESRKRWENIDWSK